MPATVQDALIHLMVVTASTDNGISARELAQIDGLVARTPVFAGYDRTRLTEVANQAVDAVNARDLDSVLDEAIEAIPQRLQDTAYALVVEVAVVDLHLPQEELRFLEMVRDRLQVDRLVTAAIEASARARMRKP
ncbi:MAG TPA: tellurite resistance TerB family protein [Alphaproteobacteria bacterium]|nr:tellurite resistance TerB family protein [Alphaproteobacteria bacterium]